MVEAKEIQMGLGMIRAVSQGDRVTLIGASKAGAPPPLKEVHLAYIMTPQMGTMKKKEEAFGFAARETLRKKCIGRKVNFRVLYTKFKWEFAEVVLPAIPATPTAPESPEINLSLFLVQEGLAKAALPEELASTQLSEEIERAEIAAQKEEKNIWTKDSKERLLNLRIVKTTTDEDFNFQAFLKECKKQPKISGIIEYIISGINYNIYLPELSTLIRFNIKNLFSPSKDLQPAGKAFAEKLLLHRNIGVKIEDADEGKNVFYGRLIHPMGDIAFEVLNQGFAKLVIPRGVFDREYFGKLRKGMETAQLNRRGMWKDFDPTKAGSLKLDIPKEFEGKVIEVFSGDCIFILRVGDLVEQKVYLAGVRAPSVGGINQDPSPWGWEAKELLRKRLLGKKVNVEMEYSKEIPPKEGIKEVPRTFHFGSVFHVTTKASPKNLAVMLLEEGLCNLLIPRAEEKMSKYFEEMTKAEGVGKEKKLGLHGVKDPPQHKYVDLIGPLNKKKAKSYQEFFKQEKTLTGVVEKVTSATHLKVRVNETNCLVSLICHGIRAPMADRNQVDLGKLADIGVSYARSNLLQRDVGLEVGNCNPHGVYYGHIFLNKKNYSVSLLEEGLAFVPQYTGGIVKYKESLFKAEESAKAQKKGLWADAVNAVNIIPELSSKTVELLPPSAATLDIELSDILDVNSFFVYDTKNKLLERVAEGMKESFDPEKAAKLKAPIRKGTVCAARFSMDGMWYRVKIERNINETMHQVSFIDYGNYEAVSDEDLRILDKAILGIPPQAIPVSLAYVRGAPFSSDVGEEAANFLREELMDKKLQGKPVYKEGGVINLVIKNEDSQDLNQSLNAHMLKIGLVRLDRWMDLPPILHGWKAIEDAARLQEKPIWRTVDPDEDEEF